MRAMNRSAIFGVALMFLTVSVAAQDDQYDETQIVTGVRENAVKNALKISDTPVLVDTTLRSQNLEYDLLPRRVETTYHIDTIQAARLRMRESLNRLYKGYIRGGIGLFTTPLAEIRYNSVRSRNSAFGAHAKHFSSKGGINEVLKSSYSDNLVDVWGRKFFREHEGSIGAKYERNMVHYYGFHEDSLARILENENVRYDSKDIRQIYNYIEGRAGWKSYYRDSTKLNHTIDARYYHYTSAFNSRENNMLLTGHLVKFINNDHYTLDISLDYNNYKRSVNEVFQYYIPEGTEQTVHPENATNNAILKLRPQIVKRGRHWHALIGIGVYTELASTAKFHFYPDAEFKYSLFDDMLTPYVGLTGKLERNSYYTLTQENPFLLGDVSLFNSSVDYELYGGLRGRFSREISFNVGVNYSRTRDMPLFVNDIIFSSENRFDIIYDRVDQFKIFGELTFLKHEKLLVLAKASYTTYSLRTQPEAWHLPNLRIDLTTDYNLGKKLYAKIRLHAQNDRTALSVLNVPGAEPAGENFSVKLKGFVDADLGLEYRYTNRLSAFVEVRNVFASRYEQWYRFPAQRFLLLGGASFSF